MGGGRVKATSSAALPTDKIVRDGVRGRPDIGVIATRENHEVDVLIWNYHDEDIAASSASIDAQIDGLPLPATPGVLEHFRIDSNHSNAFAAWKEMGSPQSPSPEQAEHLQKEGQLQLLASPKPMTIENGAVHLRFELPRQSLSLIRLTW
jgi:xylan 1,4-beta-xylosidase